MLWIDPNATLGYYTLTKRDQSTQEALTPQRGHAPAGVNDTRRERTSPPKGMTISLEPEARGDTYNQGVKRTSSGLGDSLPGRSPPIYEVMIGTRAEAFPTVAA
jgi:hypothetical protein